MKNIRTHRLINCPGQWWWYFQECWGAQCCCLQLGCTSTISFSSLNRTPNPTNTDQPQPVISSTCLLLIYSKDCLVYNESCRMDRWFFRDPIFGVKGGTGWKGCVRRKCVEKEMALLALTPPLSLETMLVDVYWGWLMLIAAWCSNKGYPPRPNHLFFKHC